MASEVATSPSNVTNLPVAAHQGARTVSSWRGIRPTSMDEAWRMAKVLALAPNMLPKTYIEVDRRDLRILDAVHGRAPHPGAFGDLGLSQTQRLPQLPDPQHER